MAVDVSNHTIGGTGAGQQGNIYPFPSRAETANNVLKHGDVMPGQWTPDIVDYRCFDDDKASFIYGAALAYLETTIKISDTLDDRIFKILGLIVAALSTLVGFMLLKCDFASFACKADGGNVFWPAATLLAGFAISGFVLASGAFRHQAYALPGNQPCNLIRNDLCNMSVALMKVSSAVGMDERIKNNLANLDRTSKRLRLGVKIALISLLLSACMALIATTSLPQKRQTSPSLPSEGSASER